VFQLVASVHQQRGEPRVLESRSAVPVITTRLHDRYLRVRRRIIVLASALRPDNVAQRPSLRNPSTPLDPIISPSRSILTSSFSDAICEKGSMSDAPSWAAQTNRNKATGRIRVAKAKSKTKDAAGDTDRRESTDLREESSDLRNADEPVACERRGERRKVQRRRQIDPTTCERDYTDVEIEFMQAMDEYKRSSGRMFPTCSEILEVVQALGYERINKAVSEFSEPVDSSISERELESLTEDAAS